MDNEPVKMNKRKIEEALKYHNSTKHPGMPPHYLDWANQPIPFKIYTDLESIKIPEELPSTDVPVLTATSAPPLNTGVECIPDLKTLGSLLFFSAGITKKKGYPGGDIYFRAAACTGALYHIDLYLVTGDVEGLNAGVYHFGPHDFSLKKLRDGDFRGVLVNAAAEEPRIAHAPVTIVCTSTFWRNSWKYQARAYRHTFWDNGTILANLLAVASAHKIPASVVLGFVDSEVNHLLGLDPDREIAVSLVPLGYVKNTVQESPEVIEDISYETMPLSEVEVDCPSIREMHRASSLIDKGEVKEWRRKTIESKHAYTSGKFFPIEVDDGSEIGRISETIERTILRRGSTRRFARTYITFRQLSDMLYCATRGVSADFLTPFGSTLNEVYLIANDVEGIPKGAYFYHRDGNSLELLREGNFRREAGHLGLGQSIPADASADIFLLANLDYVLEKFGNRGYRAAQLEAGIIGGKLYLAAYGLGLGASGLTFFDDDVTEFFSPHAEDKSTMFLIALGKSAKIKSR